MARLPFAVAREAEVVPQPGAPCLLVISVTYALGDEGLIVTHRIQNVGADAAPVALGQHPYLAIGDGPTADVTVQLDASTRFLVDEQKIPIGEAPVDAGTDVFDADLPGWHLVWSDEFTGANGSAPARWCSCPMAATST